MKLKQFIFALVAMLSSFAFTANAQNVAKVGNTEYATIDEAIANWTNGTTLTLLADVTLSDVINLSSTEHHILDLGTYTMTAASKKDAIQIVNNGRSSASYALDIKADANKPGGITATGKAVVRTTGKSGVKDRPIIRFYNGVFTGTNVVYHSGSNGTNCPQFWFYGGEFNGTIYANRALIQFYGGTFNGSLQMSVDSSAYALVAGGRFKQLSNLYMSALNSGKFTIGSAKGVYDRGIYVDKDGYYVVTSKVITEVSAKYPAVKKESYGSNNYFYYSAAQEYGMFYEVASMAGTGSNVTVYEHAEVVEELDNNTAVKDFTPTLPSEVVTFEVEAIDIEATAEATTKVTFNVEPKNASGAKVSNPSAAITFRLPVPAAWSGKANVYHGSELLGACTIKEESGAKYVEVSSSSFSEFSVEAIVPTEVEVATLAELQAALADNSNELPIIITETIVIPAGETVTIDLNGKTVTVPETTGKHIYALNNKGNLTLKDTKGNGSITARGIYNGYNGTSTDETVDGAKMTIESGKYIGMDTDGGAAIFNCAELVVNGGDFTGGVAAINNRTMGVATITAGNYHGGNNYVIQNNGGQLTIDDATVDSGFGAVGNFSGTTVINDGTYLPTGRAGATCHVVYVAGAANVTINGGTFKMNYPEGSTPDSGSAVASYYNGTVVINGGSFTSHFDNVSPVELSAGATIKGGTYLTHSGAASNHTYIKNYLAEDVELNENGTVAVKPVAEVNGVKYASFAEAAAAAQAGDEIKLLANIDGDITVPANVTLNGNDFAISGGITAAGEITFAGVTEAASFNVENTNTVVNIPDGASLQLTGTGRMVIGHGCTFNITGTIADNAAKTTDKATLTPSLVMPGASFTGAGVTFNVTNAYISAPSSYCSSSKSASETFDFNITNSIWDNAGKLAFESQSTAATVNFDLVNSVLNTGSHLVFGVSRGEVVIDNSNVNVGTSRQIENQSTMTIKNGSVVNGAVATSSNAKNPGTIIVENATYAVTGEFSGSDLGTGTLIIKKGANVSVGSIKAGANVTVDAEGMTAGDEINFNANLTQFTGSLSVINNDNLEASFVDGKIVLATKPAAKIGDVEYTSLEDAFKAAIENQTITLLNDATPALTSQRAITKAAVIDLGGKTLTLKEDDLYFGTTTFKNGTIIVDPSVKPSTAVFWMFENQVLTFEDVKLTATGVTGTYLIGLDGNNSDLNLLNGSEILVENTTALDLDIICVNASTGNDIYVENSKVNVKNLDGRVFFRGNYTVAGNSEVKLEGITKAGFHIEAGQTLTIKDNAVVNIEGEPRDGGIHLTDLTATYTKAETATVNATVNEPKVAKVGENTYRTLAEAVAAAQPGNEVVILKAGTYNVPTGKNLTITAAVEGVEFANIGAHNMGGASMTFNNVTFTYATNSTYKGLQHSGDLVYNNCIFNGQVFLYGESETFNKCTFNTTDSNNYNVWTYGAKEVAFNECIFNSAGKSVLVYTESATTTNDVAFTKCELNASAPVDGKAAIEMDSSLSGAINLTIDGETTATGFANGNVSGNSLWNNKKGNKDVANNDITVVVGDETVLAPAPIAVYYQDGTNEVFYDMLKAVPYTTNYPKLEGATIKLLADVAASGLRFMENDMVFDLNDHTYTITAGTGSQGTNTSGFQIRPEVTTDVTFKNGTIKVAEGAPVVYMFNNYATNFILENVTVDCTNMAWSYGNSCYVVVSRGNATTTGARNVEFKGNTTIENFNSSVAGTAYSIDGTMTVGENVECGGSFKLAAGATLTAKEGLDVETVDGYILAYNNGVYATISTTANVATYAELKAAIANADIKTIVLTADINCGTEQLAITKEITLDLGGKTLTTGNAYGGMSIKGNPTIKNGTIVHASNTAAIKVWNATAFEDLVIDVQGKGDANKTIGGIVLQSGSTTKVGSIKNVTIKGAALTNGIETYNCGDATENVIGSMENVTIDAQGTGLLISAPCGTATNCDIKGGVNGVEIFIKGNYSASLDLVNSKVDGGVYAHDEFSSNPSIVNNGTLKFTADAATTGASAEDVTLEIARAEAEKVQGVLNDVMENAQAKVNNVYYATLDAAIKDAKAGDVVTVFAGTYPVPAMKAGITIVGEGNVLFEGTLSGTLENLTMKNIHIKGGNAQRWAYAKGNLVFENVTFEATSVYALHFDGITEGTNLTYKNCTIIGWAALGGSPASCVFDGCTIKDNGAYGVIRTYFDTTIKDCTFNVANANTTDAYEDGIHAVEGANVVVDNCTNANGDMKDLVNVHATSIVVLDGVEIKNAAQAGSKYYATFAEALAAVKAGETLTLFEDINLSEILVLDKAITLDGNGKKLTSTAGRAINVSGADGVTIKNLTINASGERAINVIQNATNVTIDNVTATAANYTVNVAGSAPNAVVTIKNSTLNGLCTVNVAAAEANVTVDNSTVNCNDNNTTAGEAYAALCLNKDAVGGSIVATNSTINVTDGSDSKKGRNGAENGTVSINGSTDGVAVMVAAITYEGSDYYYSFETLEDAINAVQEGDTITLLRNVTMDYNARDAYETQAQNVVIDGNGKVLTLNQKNSDWASFGLANDSKLVLKNMTIEKTGYGDTNGAWNTHAIIFSCPVEMTDVTVNNSVAVQAGATLNNVTINEANGYYGLWINGNGQAVTVNGGAINATNGGRGIKIADQYIASPAQVTLNVDGTVFNTAKKAAVLVSSTAGAQIAAANVDIANVAEDNVNFVWVDEDWAQHFGNVEVTGATVRAEGVAAFTAAITANGTVQAYYKTLAEAIDAAEAGATVELLADIEANEVILIDKSLTINGNDHKVTSSATRVFRVTTANTEVTLNNVNMVSTAVRVGTNDVRGISIDIVDDVKLTLNNSSVDFTDASANDWAYAVNVTGGNNHVVIVNGGEYEGANVINVRGANNNVTVKDAVITSLYPNNDMYYGACIWVLQNQGSSVEATGNTFNGSNAIVFNIGTGTALTESNNTDNTEVVVAKIGAEYYTSLADAFAAGGEVTVLHDIVLAETAIVPAGKVVTLNLNGKTITATDNATGSYAVITNQGDLTINGEGAIRLTATNNRGWNAYSSVISNTVGGKLTVNGGTIEHLGGTDMAYAIDNLTNGKGTYAETIINGGTVKSTYRAIRQFLNGTEAQNILTVNGGTIEGANKSIWMQGPNTSANPGALTIAAEAAVKGDVYLTTTAGTAEYPVSVSIAAEALKDGAQVLTSNVPGYYVVANVGGVWQNVAPVAAINGKGYATLAAAIAAVQAGDNTIELLADCAENVTIAQVNGTNIVINGNGKTYTGTITIKGDGVQNNLYNTETLTFQNINFVPAYHTYAIDTESKTYARNITVDSCTFKGNNDVYGIRARNAYNYTVKNTTAEGIYTFFYAQNVLTGLTVENVSVECGYVAFSGTYGFGGASFKNVTVESDNTGVKVNNPNGSALTFESCSITAKTPVTFIESAGHTSALTAEFNGTNTMVVNNGGTYWFDIVEADGVDATFKAIVNDAALDMSNTAFAASVGNVYYNGLQKAIDAAVDNDTVVVARDIELDTKKYTTQLDNYVVLFNVKGKAVTFDLNGKKIDVNASAANLGGNVLYGVFSADFEGDFTITDSSAEGTGAVNVAVNDAKVYSVFFSENEGDKTKSGKITVNGGKFTTVGKVSNAMFFTDANEVITVNGGNFYCDGVSTSTNYPWMFNTYENNILHVTVNGGTFNVDINHQYRPFEVFVPENLAVKANGDGTWTIVPAQAYVTELLGGTVNEAGTYEHKVGYATVAEAFASQYGSEVTMLVDVELSETVTLPAGKEVVLDLNGKTISANIAEQLTKSFAAIMNRGTLTIKDASAEADGKISVSYAGNSFGYGVGLYTISNEGGVLNIEGGTIENTTTVDGSMYDAIDNNSTLGETVLNISGGKVVCGKYIGVRQFANNTTYDNIVNVTGGEVVGGNTSIWMQNPGSNQPKATIAISGADYENGNYPVIKGRLLAGESTGFNFEVTGGLFDTDVNAFCATDYASYNFGDGTWGVESIKINELTIVDGDCDEFENQNAKTVGTLTYKRELWNDLLWNPLFVPFEIPVSEFTKLGLEVVYMNDVHSYDDDRDGRIEKMTMESIKLTSGKLHANHPYMFRRIDNNSATELNIVLNNATLYSTSEENHIKIECSSAYTRFEIDGTYSTMTSGELGDRLIITESGDWTKIDPQWNLDPFRLYLTITQKNGSPVIIEESAMKSIKIRVVGEELENGTTVIYDVEAENNSEDAIFDLSGRRVLKAEKGGIYIINGKKVLVK